MLRQAFKDFFKINVFVFRRLFFAGSIIRYLCGVFGRGFFRQLFGRCFFRDGIFRNPGRDVCFRQMSGGCVFRRIFRHNLMQQIKSFSGTVFAFSFWFINGKQQFICRKNLSAAAAFNPARFIGNLLLVNFISGMTFRTIYVHKTSPSETEYKMKKILIKVKKYFIK